MLTTLRESSPFLQFWEGKEKYLIYMAIIWRNVHHDFGDDAYHDKLINQDTDDLHGMCWWISICYLSSAEPRKNLTCDVTFLGESYGDWGKVDVQFLQED